MFDELYHFLNRYTPVSSDDFELLMKKAETCNFPKKAILTKTGDTEQYLYFVVKGLTRKFFLHGDQEIITHIVPEGGIISAAASFFSQTPSKYTVDAIEPVTVLALSRKNFDELLGSGKKWEKIMRLMVTRFFLVQEYRLLDNIRYTARERFKIFIRENPDMVLRVPQKYLASYLNIKPETFSRMKHLMVEKKISGPAK